MTDGQREVSSLRATAHPVRLQILSLLTGAELSAAEIGRELAISHANASYHLRFLAEYGLVVEAGEEKIRGGVAKRYRHPWEEKMVSGVTATREDGVQYVRVMGEEMIRRFAGRDPGLALRSHLTDADLWVHPDVWSKVQALVEEASMLLHSAAQPPRTPDTVHAALTIAAFLLEDPARSVQGEQR